MKHDLHLVSLPWSDYELLDSGEDMKLERFGEIIVARPETQALWAKRRPELWNDAHAEFAFRDKKGSWTIKKPVPKSWPVAWKNVHLLARLTGFKHTGIFPEQAPNWQWLARCVERMKGFANPSSPDDVDVGFTKPNILNLFGYTGAVSIVAAQAGAFVTHVDASKRSLDFAHENARLSGIDENAIRWILDDTLGFVRREVRRLSARLRGQAQAGGVKYDGIILDPPAFGRGAKGEVWKIEEDLQKLLESLKELLSDKRGSFFLLNGYSAGYAPRAFAQAVESVFGALDGESGELHIKESFSERVVPAGIYVRFAR